MGRHMLTKITYSHLHLTPIYTDPLLSFRKLVNKLMVIFYPHELCQFPSITVLSVIVIKSEKRG